MIRPVLLPRTPMRLGALVALGLLPVAGLGAQQAFDRTRPPALGATPTLTVPAVHTGRLANGPAVHVVEHRELPLVQVTLTLAGGGRLDRDQPGLASFTANLLDEGAGRRDANALQSELAFLGASLSTSASWDVTTVSLKVATRNLEAALDLMADVVLRPAFSARDVARQRELRLAALLQARDRPEAVAGLVVARAVFPEGHPYHHQLAGDSASTATLDSALVRDFWTRAADPRRSTLYLVGDITPARARTLATKAFGGWRAPAAPLPLVAPGAVAAAPRPATRVILVDKPGAAQSVLSIGAPGVERGSPDYPALVVMNTLLGGSFSSRLNDILREQRGYTYGARSDFAFRPVPGPFGAGASVRTDVTDSSLAIFFREFARIRTEPVSAAELERTRQYLVLGALDNFEMNAQVAGALTGLDVFGLPLGTIPADLAAMERVTADDVRRVAERHLDPARLTVVVVGDVTKIRPGIEALGLGPIEIRDVEGRPVS